MMTVEYSESASSRIEAYLKGVRDRLRASKSVDSQEVVEDLRRHIERELSGVGQPVSEVAVGEVLERLGPPEQVVDKGDMSWWREMALRLQRGPEDRRLGYLSLGVLIVGTLVAGIFGIVASFLLSRVALSIAEEADPPAKKWLIYPSLIVVYALILILPLTWPVYAIGTLAADLTGLRPLYKQPFFDGNGLGTVLIVWARNCARLTIWWSMIWVFGRCRPRIIRAIFRPFADNWTGRTSGKVVLTVGSLTVLLAGVAVLLWVTT